MKRKDCFFGLHFDYHANEATRDIGIRFDKKTVEKIVKEVRPDFIQCDTKGHPGFSSYPTKVGYPAPNLKYDILKGWREVTKENGVLLFSHYSGIWDMQATKTHPEWASYFANGERTDKASVFGKYAEELLIPQLKELALEYKMDGAWVDGECWALCCDFSDKAKKAYYEKTGKELTELNEDVIKFTRQAFFDYVKNYITEVKKVAPDFEITSNWLNTSWVPDTVDFTDYISGDLAPTNSVNSARFDGRLMQSFGRNWDIMSWGISYPVHYPKSAVQLCQEASVIISLGGGFQVYNMQSPQNVVIDEWAIGEWAKVSKFCRERQEYCQYSSPVPNVGVLYSPKAYYYKMDNAIFNRENDYTYEVWGMTDCLSDMGHSVSIILAERKEIDYSKYNTIVVPNSQTLDNEVIDKLLEFAKNGGSLILTGEHTTKLFSEKLGYEVKERKNARPVMTAFGKRFMIESRYGYTVVGKGDYETVFELSESIIDGDLDCQNPPPSILVGTEKSPLFFTVNYGKGKIGVLTASFGKTYLNEKTWELSELLTDCFNAVGKSVLSCDKQGMVDVLLTQKGERRFIHCINLLGDHNNQKIMTFDKIPPVYEVGVELKTAEKIKELKVVTKGISLDFEVTDGGVKFVLPKLCCHDIIEIIH